MQYFGDVGKVTQPKGRVISDSTGSRLIFSTPKGRYLAARSSWNQKSCTHSVNVPSIHRMTVSDLPDDPLLDSHLHYGGPGSFTVDMQGIDAFLFARAKYFTDITARQAAVLSGLANTDTSYLRVGAAGAPPTADHPGGEVLEHALLNGPRLGGKSFAASGFLPSGSDFSLATPLTAPGSPEMLENRSVYSHTAFLPRCDGLAPGSHLLRVEGRPGGLNALDAVKEFVSASRIDSYAVRIFVRVTDPDDPPLVIGRVLRRIPQRRIKTVQQATGIASEQGFRLTLGQELHCYGTYWPRRSVDWEALRGGKPYEPRGHIHMKITGKSAGPQQHAISHLREIFVTPGTQCLVAINPITDVLRVEPVVQRGEALLSRCSGRAVVEEFSSISWSSAS